METRNFVTQCFKMSGNEDKFDKLEKFILYKGTTKQEEQAKNQSDILISLNKIN